MFENQKINEALDDEKVCKEIKDYVWQFLDFDANSEIAFIYGEKNSEEFQIILMLTRYAKRHYVLENLDINDPSKTYMTVFDKRDYDYIGLMRSMLNKVKIHNSVYIYGISTQQLILIIRNGLIEQRRTVAENEKRVIDSLMETGMFHRLYDMYYILQNVVQIVIDEIERKEGDYFQNNCYMNLWRYNNIYNEITNKLRAQGKITARWKHEFELYLLTKKYFPNAIYQYRVSWLNKQSIDIYIPDIQLAIEYQGEQHYKEIELFGGKDGLESRQKLDEKKRRLCNKNGINLLEWEYLEPINDTNFIFHIKELIGVKPEIKSDNYIEKKWDSGINILDIYELNVKLECYSENEWEQIVNEKNLEQIYRFFINLIECGCIDKVRKRWLEIAEKFTEKETQIFLYGIIQRHDKSDGLIKIIVDEEKLLSLYLNTDRLNYYYRYIIIEMVMNGKSKDKIVYYLNRIKKRMNSVRSFRSNAKALIVETNDRKGNVNLITEVLKELKVIR